MEPHKHDEMKYFPLEQLPLREEAHSVFYPTLREFQEKIERLIQEKVIISD